MGQMQRRKRISREIMGKARRKVLAPKLVYRRFAQEADRLVAAFTSLVDGLEKLASSGFLAMEQARRAAGLSAKTFDKRITPP